MKVLSIALGWRLFGGLWVVGLLSFVPVIEAQDRDIEVAGNLRTQIPQDLKGLYLSNPYVAILVEVNSEGEVVDRMPFEATHYGLIEKAMMVLDKVTFLPSIVDGVAQGSRTKVYVNFYDIEQQAWRSGGGFMPQGGSVTDALDRRIYEASAEKFLFGESEVSELDKPLRIVATRLRVYTSEEGISQDGSCLVEYFVGPDGKVCFPNVLESDHDDLGMSALLTLEVTEFEPPRRGGNPTFVRVRQPFNFKKEESTTAN